MELYINTVFIIAILLNAIAGVFITAFVIPLQVEQAGVKNGLVKLRKQMLFKGFLSLVVIATVITILVLRLLIPSNDILGYLIGALIVVNSIGILGKSYIDYQIYHQQYSQQSKDMHERIDVLEQGDRRRAKKAQG